jgi:hypothetical protein
MFEISSDFVSWKYLPNGRAERGFPAFIRTGDFGQILFAAATHEKGGRNGRL